MNVRDASTLVHTPSVPEQCWKNRELPFGASRCEAEATTVLGLCDDHYEQLREVTP